MNPVSTLLTFHLAGAAVFGVLLLVVTVALIAHKADYDRALKIAVAAMTILQIGTGVALSVMVSEGVVAVCSKAFVYLAVAGVAEYLLIQRQPQVVAAHIENK
jgi:hypothetical protein